MGTEGAVDPHSIGQNSITCSYTCSQLSARKAGNYSLAVCLGRRGKWMIGGLFFFFFPNTSKSSFRKSQK